MKQLIILITLLLFISLTHAQNLDSDSLVAHYKLSKDNYNAEGNYFYDLSGNGNHATASDTFQFEEDHLGNPDGAMQFDGEKDFLDCGNDDKFNLSNDDVTIMAWIKPKFRVGSAYSNSFTLFSKNEYQNDFYFAFREHGGFRIFSQQSNNSTSEHSKGRLRFYNDQYHLFSFVFEKNNRQIKIYHNAILHYTIDITNFQKMSNNGNFIIGSSIYKLYPFLGTISELYVYAQKLNNDEINKFYGNLYPHYLTWDFEKGYFAGSSKQSTTEDGIFGFTENPRKNNDPHSTTLYKYPESSDINNIIPYSGEYCLKHECKYNYNKAETGPIGRGDKEGEFKTYQSNGEERWYRWKFLIPNDFDFTNENPEWCSINQMWEPYASWGAPTYSLHILKNKFRFRASLWTKDSDSLISHQEMFNSIVENISLEKNKWYDIVYHIYTTDDSSSFFEGWINNISILKENFDTTVTQRKSVPAETNIGIIDKPLDHGHTYTYKIRNHRLIGQNLRQDDWIGLSWSVGYYRANHAIKQSVYTDDYKIGKTATSIDFNIPELKFQQSSLVFSSYDIDYNNTLLNSISTKSLLIKNVGNDTVTLLNYYTTDTTNFVITDKFYNQKITPKDSILINIHFTPKLKTESVSNLIILSNDSIQDSIAIKLNGTSTFPPKLKISVPTRK